MKSLSHLARIAVIATILMGLSLNARSGYLLNGSAVALENQCFTLTPPLAAQGGWVWNDQPFSLDYDFDVTFQVFLGFNDFGADGIAFVIQPNSSATGGIGGGIGYLGISPSIAVEFDTYQNDDPSFDHLSIQRNGDVNSTGTVAGTVQASATSINIEDGQWHTARIIWSADLYTLTVYFDGNHRLTYIDDMVSNTFGGNPMVYWGFTGATGGATNLQQFCVTELNFEVPATPVSSWALAIPIILILGSTILLFRRNF